MYIYIYLPLGYWVATTRHGPFQNWWLGRLDAEWWTATLLKCPIDQKYTSWATSKCWTRLGLATARRIAEAHSSDKKARPAHSSLLLQGDITHVNHGVMGEVVFFTTAHEDITWHGWSVSRNSMDCWVSTAMTQPGLAHTNSVNEFEDFLRITCGSIV